MVDSKILEMLRQHESLINSFGRLTVEQKIGIISFLMSELQKQDPAKFREMVNTIPEVFDLY